MDFDGHFRIVFTDPSIGNALVAYLSLNCKGRVGIDMQWPQWLGPIVQGTASMVVGGNTNSFQVVLNVIVRRIVRIHQRSRFQAILING